MLLLFAVCLLDLDELVAIDDLDAQNDADAAIDEVNEDAPEVDGEATGLLAISVLCFRVLTLYLPTQTFYWPNQLSGIQPWKK